MSLIEALVAVAVMAFGMLGIAGIQSTLRSTSDESKQRGEAVRVAQDMLEDARAFVLLGATGNVNAPGYDDLATAALASVTGSSATFTRNLTVADSNAGRHKLVSAQVGWTDRAGSPQQVVLSSVIAGVTPEVSGTLSVRPTGFDRGGRAPHNRNPAIPLTATDQGVTSSFTPPGSSLTWIFDNLSGVITRTCLTPNNCTDVNMLLLSGFVRFATGPVQPSELDAIVPSSSALPGVQVVVDQTAPNTASITCFEEVTPGYLLYYCAIPITTLAPRWSGTAGLDPLSLPLAASPVDASSSAYRVCRYRADPSYVDIEQSLANQNYLVIAAGAGSAPPFSCPASGTVTWAHQP